MPKFLVRQNCEYSTTIEAPNEDAALMKASDLPTDEWDAAWSDQEAEEEVPENKGA